MPVLSALRSRGCLVSLVVAAAVAITAWALVRRALDSARLRAATEARLSTVLGQPVSIGGMRVHVFPVPSVEGDAIQVGRASVAAPSIALRRIRVVPALGSLLRGPVVINRIELDGLTVNVLREPTGRWLLPFAAAGAATVAGGLEGTGRDPGDAAAMASVDVREIALTGGVLALHAGQPGGAVHRVAALTEVAADVRRDGGTTVLEDLEGRFGSATITGDGRANRQGMRLSLGWDAIRSSDLPQLFALIGTTPPHGLAIDGERPLTLQLVVDAAGALSATGTVAAQRLALGTLALTSLRAPLRLRDGVIALEPLTFEAYGGRERGALTANLSAHPVGWRLRSRIEDVDVSAFLAANSTAGDRLEGRGALDATLTGTSAAPLDSLAGTAKVSIEDGIVRGLPILSAINAALRIAETAGPDTRFDTLTASLALGDRVVRSDDVRLVAAELVVQGTLTLGFDGRLQFEGDAVFSRGRSAELIARVRELSALTNGRGEIELPVAITGTVQAPDVSVDVAAATGRVLQEELRRRIGRGLKRLLERPR